MNQLFLTFKNIIHFILTDNSTVKATAFKYKETILPQNEDELNQKVITPSVLLAVRINLVKVWLNEAKKSFNEEEGRKISSGYSLEAGKSITRVSILTKNIDILTKELLSLEGLQYQLSMNYKSYLKLIKIHDLPKKQ